MNTSNVFRLPLPTGEVELCAVVATDEEYVAFVAKMADLGLVNPETVEVVLKSKHIPMISRGKKTEALFQYCNIQTSHMSIIVRGHGAELFNQLMGERDVSVN